MMRKTALFAAVAMLLSAFLNSGFTGLSSIALAAPGDEITVLQPAFQSALVAAGVDANSDGKITEAEMAAPTRLSITGYTVSDITGIGYAVNLTELNITGTSITEIPSEISNLTKLADLDFSVNNLDSAGLPATLWTMASLKTLDLQMNQIHTLPDGIDGLANLTELNLYGNGLTALPSAIGNLGSLTGLYLQRNSLFSLPDSVCSLSQLETLTLWNNNITALPANIGSLSALKDLDLDGNALGSLPASFKSLTSLTRLMLGNNRLTGLPAGVFANMLVLNRMEIDNNYLDPQAGHADRVEIDAAKPTGTSKVYTPQHDYAVSLNYNGGSGSALPRTRYYHGESITLPVASKTNFAFAGWDLDNDGTPDAQAGEAATVQPSPVTAASVAYKAIYGYTVTFATQRFGTIDGASADIKLNINPNEHVGDVAAVPAVAPLSGYEFLGWFDGVTLVPAADILTMDVTGNKTFTALYQAIGTIHFTNGEFYNALIAAGVDSNSDAFITDTEMQALTTLSLSGGKFTSIAGIGEAVNLQSLSLGTGIMTALPDELCGLTKLKTLDISGNLITTLPESIIDLTGLETLDMSGCGLTVVSTYISSLDALTELNVADNGLTSLPGWLPSLTGLESLDVSGNLLTALDDNCFTGMTGLTSLDLSGNYFNPGSMPVGAPAMAVILPQKTYAITLDFAGGTGAALPKTGYYYGEEIPLPMASCDESEFTGWDIDGDGNADTVEAGSTSLTPVPPQSITSKTYKAIYLSRNARLSGIDLSAGAIIDPAAAFDPDGNGCTIILYDYVSTVTITPQKANAHAEMLLNDTANPGITVTLPTAADTADVSVSLTAEDGVTTRDYMLHVQRAAAVDLGLAGLTLSAGVTRSPAFSTAVTAYTVLMPATIGTVTVSAARMSSLATVTIDGTVGLSKPISIGMGTVVSVPVTVSSPLTTDKTKTYTLTFKRGTAATKFAAIPKVGAYPTLSPGGSNRMTFSYTMGGPGTVKIEVYKSRRWVQIMTRTETTAGVKTWAWDGKVSGAYLPVAAYPVRITPSANGITGTATTVNIKIVKYPTVSWRTYAKTFKAKGSVYALCTFKVNYPTNATVRVYNSRGRIAAVARDTVNMMPSSAYTAVTWNGRATSGNTAGLAAGALVPAGTYTIRITTGVKVYIKTIKITR